MNVKEFTLVIQGGSMRGIYSAGVLDVFLEYGIRPTLVYGTSAGALVGVNFLSEQPFLSRDIMLEMAADKEFMSLSNILKKRSFFDFDYLFRLTEEKAPGANKAFFDSPVRFYAVATDLEDGKSALFSKDDPNFWKGLEASCSLPLLSKPVEINGKSYLDGGIVSPIALNEAIVDHVGPIVVISTRERGYRKKTSARHIRALTSRLVGKFPKVVQEATHPETVYNPLFDKLDFMQDNGDLLAIYASEPLSVKSSERDREVLEKVYNLGVDDCRAQMSRILSFLS